jgi:hypothetical protein
VKSLLSLFALSSAALLCSCAGVPQMIPPVPAPEKVALVSFSLNKSITAAADIGQNNKQHDAGPGLLQKDSSYYSDHQAALDSLWEKYQEKLSGSLGIQLVPIADIASNAKYQELTVHVPKKVLGSDIASGADRLEPHGGLKFVDVTDTAKLRALTEALGVQKLLLIDNNAEYEGSITLGGNGTAKMDMETRLAFYDPAKGVYWRGRYLGTSKSSAVMLAGTISTSAFPKLIPETADPILAKIAQDAARGRGETPAK